MSFTEILEQVMREVAKRYCSEEEFRQLQPTPQQPEPAQSSSVKHSDFVINFGKYKGKTLREIWEIDKGYVEWMASKITDERIQEELK